MFERSRLEICLVYLHEKYQINLVYHIFSKEGFLQIKTLKYALSLSFYVFTLKSRNSTLHLMSTKMISGNCLITYSFEHNCEINGWNKICAKVSFSRLQELFLWGFIYISTYISENISLFNAGCSLYFSNVKDPGFFLHFNVSEGLVSFFYLNEPTSLNEFSLSMHNLCARLLHFTWSHI